MKNTHAAIGLRAKKIITLIVLLLLLSGLGSGVGQLFHFQIWPEDAQHVDLAIALLFLAYSVCMIIPFMPAIELGLLLLMMLDIRGVVFLYGVTVISLTISFWLGRLIPLAFLVRIFNFLHLPKAGDLLNKASQQGEPLKIDILLTGAPKKIIPFMLRHRYWLVAFALNLPGNAIIGGGGGIGMICGMSRLLSYSNYIFTIAIAAIPLPAIFITKQLIAA